MTIFAAIAPARRNLRTAAVALQDAKSWHAHAEVRLYALQRSLERSFSAETEDLYMIQHPHDWEYQLESAREHAREHAEDAERDLMLATRAVEQATATHAAACRAVEQAIADAEVVQLERAASKRSFCLRSMRLAAV